jgi:hypothetical protein
MDFAQRSSGSTVEGQTRLSRLAFLLVSFGPLKEFGAGRVS